MTLRCDMIVPPPVVASIPTVAMSVCSPLLNASSAGLTDPMFDPQLDALFGLDNVDLPFLSPTWSIFDPAPYSLPTLSASMPFANTNGSLTPPPPHPPIQLPPYSLVPCWQMPSCSTSAPTFSSRSSSASASSAAALSPVLTTGAAPSAQLQTLESYVLQRVSAQSPPPAFPWKQEVISSLMPPPEPTTALDHCAAATHYTRGPLPVSAWSPEPLPVHAVPPAAGAFAQLLEPCPEFAWPGAALTPVSSITQPALATCATALPAANRGTQLPITPLYAPTLVSSNARQQLPLPLPPPPPPPTSASQSQQRTRTSRQPSMLETLLSSNSPTDTHSVPYASGGLFGETNAPPRRGAQVGPPAVTAPLAVQSLEPSHAFSLAATPLSPPLVATRAEPPATLLQSGASLASGAQQLEDPIMKFEPDELAAFLQTCSAEPPLQQMTRPLLGLRSASAVNQSVGQPVILRRLLQPTPAAAPAGQTPARTLHSAPKTQPPLSVHSPAAATQPTGPAALDAGQLGSSAPSRNPVTARLLLARSEQPAAAPRLHQQHLSAGDAPSELESVYTQATDVLQYEYKPTLNVITPLSVKAEPISQFNYQPNRFAADASANGSANAGEIQVQICRTRLLSGQRLLMSVDEGDLVEAGALYARSPSASNASDTGESATERFSNVSSATSSSSSVSESLSPDATLCLDNVGHEYREPADRSPTAASALSSASSSAASAALHDSMSVNRAVQTHKQREMHSGCSTYKYTRKHRQSSASPEASPDEAPLVRVTASKVPKPDAAAAAIVVVVKDAAPSEQRREYICDFPGERLTSTSVFPEVV